MCMFRRQSILIVLICTIGLHSKPPLCLHTGQLSCPVISGSPCTLYILYIFYVKEVIVVNLLLLHCINDSGLIIMSYRSNKTIVVLTNKINLYSHDTCMTIYRVHKLLSYANKIKLETVFIGGSYFSVYFFTLCTF